MLSRCRRCCSSCLLYVAPNCYILADSDKLLETLFVAVGGFIQGVLSPLPVLAPPAVAPHPSGTSGLPTTTQLKQLLYRSGICWICLQITALHMLHHVRLIAALDTTACRAPSVIRPHFSGLHATVYINEQLVLHCDKASNRGCSCHMLQLTRTSTAVAFL